MHNGIFDNSNVNVSENSLYPMFQEVIYYAAGKEEEAFCPYFSVFGFRYVRVSGYEGEIRPGDFVAVAVYSDMEETLSLESSDLLINQVMSNIRWSQKGNFLDVPTIVRRGREPPGRGMPRYIAERLPRCLTSTVLWKNGCRM